MAIINRFLIFPIRTVEKERLEERNSLPVLSAYVRESTRLAVSQSEGGFEAVYQSSAVIPHWRIVADASRCWEVDIAWTLDRVAVAAPSRPAARPRMAELPA